MNGPFLRAARLAAGADDLLVRAEHLAHSVIRGGHGRRRAGGGDAFWQFRVFQTGDEIRTVDWRQSAKGDRVFVREKEDTAAQTLSLWRDSSASMDFSSVRGRLTKRATADTLLLALAILSLRGGERVHLPATTLPPQTMHTSAHRLAAALDEQTAWPLELRTGCAVFFSDFYLAPDALSENIERLKTARVRGVLAQVYDPAETTLHQAGRIRFEDMEDAHPSSILIGQAQAARGEYEQLYTRHRAALAHIARTAGWRFTAINTAEPLEDALQKLYLLLSGGRA